MSWYYEEIKSSVARFSAIKLHKPTIASDPTMHTTTRFDKCRSKEVTLYLDQTDLGSWDVESAYSTACTTEEQRSAG